MTDEPGRRATAELSSASASPAPSSLVGVAFGLGAFCLWGLMPVLFKSMQHVPPVEILSHRIVWSLLGVGGILILAGQGPTLLTVLANRKAMSRLLLSTTVITVNWLLFIWAVNNGHVLQASLGYYLNPMLNVLLGVVILKERLTRAQWLAVVLVIGALAAFTIGLGEFPWISVTLALAFSIYGLARKTMPVGAAEGLAIETSILFPAAFAYLIYLGWTGEGHFLTEGWEMNLLLIGAGVATAIPLVMFAAAARRLRYATVGFLQYITPTIQFMLAVLIYGETFTDAHVMTFALIWVGIAIYTFETMRTRKRR